MIDGTDSPRHIFDLLSFYYENDTPAGCVAVERFRSQAHWGSALTLSDLQNC